MKGAISLGVGEPDFVTPWGIRDAAVRSLKRGYTQYTATAACPNCAKTFAGTLKSAFR